MSQKIDAARGFLMGLAGGSAILGIVLADLILLATSATATLVLAGFMLRDWLAISEEDVDGG